jgi:hypothetical protein
MATMQTSTFRPPAIPLVTHDPYFSVWSFNENLTAEWTKHWTGKNQNLCGMVRIDGKTYRWLSPGIRTPDAVNSQLEILPHETCVRFSQSGVDFTVRFRGEADIRSVEKLTRPYTVVHFEATATDGKPHEIEWYFDVSAELVVNEDNQNVTWSRLQLDGSPALAMRCTDGVPLGKVGDDLRIDWGQAILAPVKGGQMALGESAPMREQFANNGTLPTSDALKMPRPVQNGWPVMAWAEKVTTPAKTGVILAYDDDPCLEYFRRQLSPVWMEGGKTIADALRDAKSSFLNPDETDRAYIQEWSSKLGQNYSNLAVLSYRQSLAGHKIVRDIDGTLLMFGKENFSNGCIGTVDVMYPACPIFLAYNPELLKANLEPILQYASMPRWKWKFAPHDLGTYPKANGQVYGGGELTEENQMPVEESGNMLIMVAAYLDKTHDQAWVKKHWSKLTEWAEYLRQNGVDPANQLCTDDFAGHLARNANLSAKAIVAMACYAKMAKHLGMDKVSEDWQKLSKSNVKEWMKLADDGDHFRLAFDRQGTWSQKYNLVWDKVLGLNLFPPEVFDKEVASYLKRQNKYGLPLDNRATYTKLDWIVWTACLASKKEDFEAIMAPVYRWMNETPDRVPLTDWYDTVSGKCVGFRARTVVGGVFMPLLLKENR